MNEFILINVTKETFNEHGQSFSYWVELIRKSDIMRVYVNPDGAFHEIVIEYFNHKFGAIKELKEVHEGYQECHDRMYELQMLLCSSLAINKP